MQRLYPLLITKGKEPGFSAYVIDVPDAITQAETIEETMMYAQEALALALEDRVENGEVIPEPSDLVAAEAKLDAYDRAHKVTIQLIPGHVPEPVVRVNVTLPGDLLKRIDAIADNRSAFLADAVRKVLGASAGSERNNRLPVLKARKKSRMKKKRAKAKMRHHRAA